MSLNRAQELEVAAIVAPVLRAVPDKTKKRRVFLTDAEGNVSGESTMGEVLKGLAQDYAIEHTLKEGERPKEVFCEFCARSIKVQRVGAVPIRCPSGCDVHCPGFGKTEGRCKRRAPKNAFQRSVIRGRKSRPWLCSSCDYKRRTIYDSESVLCSGYDGNACEKRPTAAALRMAHCKGLVWRCLSCAQKDSSTRARMSEKATARYADTKMSEEARISARKNARKKYRAKQAVLKRERECNTSTPRRSPTSSASASRPRTGS